MPALMLSATALSCCSTLPASCFSAELTRAEAEVSSRSASSESLRSTVDTAAAVTVSSRSISPASCFSAPLTPGRRPP